MNTALPPLAFGFLAAAACAGAVVGWVVTRVVRRLVDPGSAPRGERRRRGDLVVVAALAAAAAGLWWWEVLARGQLAPGTPGAEVPWSDLVWRWTGHVALLGFLAAATWIDLRDRVIPDAITLPGVVTGLAWAGLQPASLPPVARVVPRSFAAPLLEPDVLGLGGPLGGTPLPAWLGPAPALGGLAIAIALFVAWWAACTAPAEPDASERRPFDPRLSVLAAGLAGIGAAWWRGGEHWPALLSALVGTAVGVAVVWATRIGASRALGREAVGFGDVTLIAVVGAWLGWQGTLLACCLGVLVGLAHGLAQVVRARGNELPFGPSLCAGAALVVVLWGPLWTRFGPAFERPVEIAVAATAVITLTALTLTVWWRLRARRAA